MRYTFDSREVTPGMGFVALKGEKADGHDFIPMALEKGAAEIVDGLGALQAKAREKRRALAARGTTVVAVTGSAGKTTTKELLKTFLACAGKTYGTEGNFNNHIGLPLTILNCPDDARFLVLEMGSNHPGEIAALCDIAEPDVGVVTGVGTAHLEFFKTRAGIAEEKGTLVARAKDFAVFPASDDFASALAARSSSQAVAVSTEGEARSSSQAVAVSTEGEARSSSQSAGGELPRGVACDAEFRLDPGKAWPPHFAGNAALAFAVASRFGVTAAQATAALEGFALPGARWKLREKWGATFIDDTYNANPDSMIAALDALVATPCDGKRVAVLGDMFELGPDALALHKKVFDHAMALKIPLVMGVGEFSSQCLCHCVYKELKTLKKKFRLDVSAGDLVLLKASHAMNLGSLIEEDS